MTNLKVAIFHSPTADPITLDWVKKHAPYEVVSDPRGYDFGLQVVENRVQLHRLGAKAPGPLEIDFQSEEWQFRAKTLSKKQVFFKALGFKESSPQILDATAGLGRDAYSCVVMGSKVTAIEQSPLVYILLQNAVDRLKQEERERFKVICDNAFKVLPQLNGELPEVIYLDPMYEKVEKKSKPKKELMYLRQIISPEQNIEALLEQALKKTQRYVVLKQPLRAPELSRRPQHSFLGKMVRYDRFVR